MVTFDRRAMLKVMGSAAAAALIGTLGTRGARAQTNPADIVGADTTDPLTPELIKARLGIRRVADNIYTLLGAGGNIGLLDGKEGVIVIDAGLPDRGKDVVRGIRAVTKNPAKLLVNTHYHFDHVGGNAEVNAAGFQIVAHSSVRPRLSQQATSQFLKMTFPAYPEAARPTVEFDEKLTLRANGETLHLTHMLPAHTDGDAYVIFEKAGVLQTGDLFFNGWYPYIDGEAGGSLDGMIAAEEKLLTIVDDKMKIIPGHGPVGGRADLQAAVDMLKQVRDKVKPQIAGKTMEEFVASKPLAFLGGKWGKGFLDDDKFAALMYFLNSLQAK